MLKLGLKLISNMTSEVKQPDECILEDKLDSKELKSSKKKFPQILMDMIDNEDNNHAIIWGLDGKSFRIICPNTFTLQILPQFFKPTEYSTFTRRLYWWGFKKISKTGGDQHYYYHKLFMRERRDLCQQISGKRETAARSDLKRKYKVEVLRENKLELSELEIKNLTYLSTKRIRLPYNCISKHQAHSERKNFFEANLCANKYLHKLPLMNTLLPELSTKHIIIIKLQNEIRYLREQIRDCNRRKLIIQNTLI